MHKIGVTGGIGSGKSTICKIFESLGIPVYYADERARVLVETHPVVVEGYKKLFGENVYTEGKLNREIVARKVFMDKDLLHEVNTLVHPVVRADFSRWVAMQNTSYVIEEAAILLESGGQKHLDNVVLVSAPEALRVKRVMERDGIDKHEVLQRIKNQWSDEQKRPFCDFEIVADGKHLVIPQVLKIHFELLK